jgi:hypothetical protein
MVVRNPLIVVACTLIAGAGFFRDAQAQVVHSTALGSSFTCNGAFQNDFVNIGAPAGSTLIGAQISVISGTVSNAFAGVAGGPLITFLGNGQTLSGPSWGGGSPGFHVTGTLYPGGGAAIGVGTQGAVSLACPSGIVTTFTTFYWQQANGL